jgi:hypothetical protein
VVDGNYGVRISEIASDAASGGGREN